MVDARANDCCMKIEPTNHTNKDNLVFSSLFKAKATTIKEALARWVSL